VKISVMSMGFERAVADGRLTHEDVIRCCKEGGADGLEPSTIFLAGVTEEVKGLLEKHDLSVPCLDVHVGLTDPDAAIRSKAASELVSLARLAKEFGASGLMIVPGSLEGGVTFDQALPWVAAGIREALPEATSLGITPMVEQMGYARAFCQRPEHLRALLNAVDMPEFSLCWDGGNFTITRQDALASMPEFLPRIRHTHFKDGVRSDAGWKTVALGDGIVPLREMFGALKDYGYGGHISVEHDGAGDAWEEAQKGIAYARSLM